ncbi:FtsQ-type POTRA domain-containing protein [Clostridium tertium]|uniref:Cell division protein DivIB n=1 Tax=Clostridium tertium TaxID=1559 RepID=A0A6N3GFM8_9CLOT
MNNKVNQFVKKKKKKKLIKRIILGLFVFIIGIIIFVYKAPLFNLKEIGISGLVTISNDSLQEKLKYNIGENIFTLNYNDIISKLKENPYIKDVKITKKGINKININITESKVAYYIESNGIFRVINNDGIIVEDTNDISDRKLVKISSNIDISSKKVGDLISENTELPKVLDDFYILIENMPEGQNFTQINLDNINNIICFIGNVEIRVGDRENLMDKINLALNLINQGTIAKGYIDMSFDGPPVINISK